MNKDFLKRLWWASSKEGVGYQGEGLNLCELYEHTEEKRQALRAFSQVLDGCSMDAELRDEIDEADSAALNAAELQGFINGWRLCAMLQGELARKGGGEA